MENIYEKVIQGLLVEGFESVDGWFSLEEINGLRETLLNHYEMEKFRLAGIGKEGNLQKVKDIRSDQIFWLPKPGTNTMEESFFKKIDDFVLYLNRTCFAGIRSYEFHYAIYEAGTFYKKHIDRFKNDDSRRFSMVFYLTENWQPGDGGELVIYKNNEQILIKPIAGNMVLFESELPHEVLLSKTQRLSLTGWLKVE